MAYPFNGTLRSNEVFSAIYNMIISQTVFADNFNGLDDNFVSKFRVDGSMYGDTKLYYAADALASTPWVQYSNDAVNVLAQHKPASPACQSITFDEFRQIALTLDEYMSKRAFATEGAFGNFQSVLMGLIRETKNIYDYTTVATFVGSTEATTGKQLVEIELSTLTETGEELARIRAQKIANAIANLMVDIKRPNRSYNDLGFLRSFSEDQLRVIWNAKYVNEITKLDLPTIFHKEGLVEKLDSDILPPEYFGVALSDTTIANYSDATPAAGKPINSTTGAYTPGVGNANGCLRSLIETDVTVSGTAYHLFPGDELPAGATVTASTGAGQFKAAEVYFEKDDVICKIIGTRSVPFMSAFEVGTSFYNPKNLSTNHYLTWGHNTLDYLKNYPYITVYED